MRLFGWQLELAELKGLRVAAVSTLPGEVALLLRFLAETQVRAKRTEKLRL